MLRQTWQFVSNHPLTKDARISAIRRYLRYQLVTRIRANTVLAWFAGAKLVVSQNMSGASGNIYCGLHEPADMGFFLHFLRAEDHFLDIGANVGSYTIIASKICGARTTAFEPIAQTVTRLRRNIEVNRIEDRVTIAQTVLLDYNGETCFTEDKDTTNRVSKSGRRFKCVTLDTYLNGDTITAIKADVEGSEEAVFSGATNALRSPALQAVESELWTESLDALFRSNGFARVYYDPFSRSLNRTPTEMRAHNALYVRDIDYALSRVRSAPARSILPGKTL